MARRKRKKLPLDTFSAHIDALSHEGRGIATVAGKTTFISNALVTEEIEFIYTAQNSRYAQGRATKILQAATERITPQCEHFGICGGCSLQHMQHETQLDLKQATLLEQLQHFAKTSADEILPPITGPTYAYRHKARLGVRYVEKKNAVLVGFREQQSRYLADMHRCPILHPSVGELITPLRQLIAELSSYQHIAQIEVAIGDTQTALIFRHLIPLPIEDEKRLCEFAQQYQLMLFLQPNKPEKLRRLYPELGEDLLSYQHPDFAITLWFHPLDFTQINPAINRQMVKAAIQFLQLTPTDRVLDLFCGLGNFTLPISKSAATATGVEGSELMVERAQMNAERNNIDNVEFFATDLSQPLTAAWAKKYYNKLLLDPARSGALEILPYLALWRVERIVYISCNPATLARDAGELCKLGYCLEKTGIIDMFPQTNHVESIAVFTKN